MSLLTYGSRKWGEDNKSWWFVIGEDAAFDRDVFRIEVDKSVRSSFCIAAQIGGDCLFELSFAFGKFSGEIRVWGY